MRLVNLTKRNAIFIDNGKIISLCVDLKAQEVLEWHAKHIPANN